MSDGNKKLKEQVTQTFLRRYSPYDRYNKGNGFARQDEFKLNPFDYGESITDKESYRLALSQGRGAVLGSSLQGQYMYPDGKYDKSKDISFILRKDLTVQEMDAYLGAMKLSRENADKEMKAEIDKQIKALEGAKLEQFKKKDEAVSEAASVGVSE